MNRIEKIVSKSLTVCLCVSLGFLLGNSFNETGIIKRNNNKQNIEDNKTSVPKEYIDHKEFNKGEHSIANYTLVLASEFDKNPDKYIIPEEIEGYEYVRWFLSEEKEYINGEKYYYLVMNYINEVPVKVGIYYNPETNEVTYAPGPGTPIDQVKLTLK